MFDRRVEFGRQKTAWKLLIAAFDTTADYRRWCKENLPDWLGYGRV